MNFIAGAAGFSMFGQSKSRFYATWPSPVDIIWKCLFSNCLLGKEVGLSQRKHRFRSLQRSLVLYFMKPCCAAVINPAFTSSACRCCLPNTDHMIPSRKFCFCRFIRACLRRWREWHFKQTFPQSICFEKTDCASLKVLLVTAQFKFISVQQESSYLFSLVKIDYERMYFMTKLCTIEKQKKTELNLVENCTLSLYLSMLLFIIFDSHK